MGILNLTPDSFYSSSRVRKEGEILVRTEQMLNEGADIIDLGAYSSRPGADHVSEDEEKERLLDILHGATTAFPDALFSVDTFRASIAEESIEAGAFMINDISGGQQDDRMMDVIGKHNVPYVLMHMRGTPQTMMDNTQYDDVVTDLLDYFEERMLPFRLRGANQVILDPGFGFSKTLDQNYELLNQLERMHELEAPILIGLSRKSMIYRKLGITPEESLPGTIALNAVALSKGANILRVHDVQPAVDLINLLR